MRDIMLYSLNYIGTSGAMEGGARDLRSGEKLNSWLGLRRLVRYANEACYIR